MKVDNYDRKQKASKGYYKEILLRFKVFPDVMKIKEETEQVSSIVFKLQVYRYIKHRNYAISKKKK